MTTEVLDPTHEAHEMIFVPAPRLPSLQGTTIGIISNGKKNTFPFFDAFEQELMETHGVARVLRRTKSNYSAPANPHLVEEAETWDAVVAGIGD